MRGRCWTLFSQKIIDNNRIAVFSKSYCPYCAKTKSLLKSKYGDVEAEIVECVLYHLPNSTLSELNDHIDLTSATMVLPSRNILGTKQARGLFRTSSLVRHVRRVFPESYLMISFSQARSTSEVCCYCFSNRTGSLLNVLQATVIFRR